MDCPPGKLRNPASGRCVNKDGKIGRAILAGAGVVGAKKSKPKPTKSKPAKSKPRPAAKRGVVNEDWTKLPLKTEQKNGWKFFTLPKGTILWHGTSTGFPPGKIATFPAFYSNKETAGFYAFRGRYHGMEGKIISVITQEPTRILNLDV